MAFGLTMKYLKVEGYVKLMSCLEEARGLLGELQGFLGGVLKDPVTGDQNSEHHVVCDRVLRACNHHVGAGPSNPEHLGCLAELAELAYRGYLVSGTKQSPLYMEKILYHLVRNLSAQGSRELTDRFGEHLYSRLAREQGPGVSEDYGALARSCFAVLWKEADSRAPEGPKLAGRLRSVRFLILLEGAGPGRPSTECATYLSLSARHSEVAGAEYEGRGAPLSKEQAAFLVRQVEVSLLRPLDPAAKAWPVSTRSRRLTVLMEVALQCCKRLCRGSCWEEAETHLRQASGLLPKSSLSFRAALGLLESGVRVLRALSDGLACGGSFKEAAVALSSLSPPAACDLERRAVIEGCQFVVWALEAGVKRAEGQGSGRGLCSQDLARLFAFIEEYLKLLQKQMDSMAAAHPEQHRLLKQLSYQSLQLYFSLAYDSLLSSQLESAKSLQAVMCCCRSAAEAMLAGLEGLSEKDQVDYFNKTAYCVNNLSCGLYNLKLYSEALSLAGILCRKLGAPGCPDLSPERLHRAFLVSVQCCRKTAQFQLALEQVGSWLLALGGRVTEHMSEPVSLWVRTKAEAARGGVEDARLRTLKDALGPRASDPELLLALLEEELRAYRALQGDTAQERYNTLCDLLEICHEDSGRSHERAVYLCELGQVLCYRQDFTEQTDCSALDSVREALRLLDLVPETPVNRDRLLDERAQASLWLCICSLESSLLEAVERDRRLRAAQSQAVKSMEAFEPNDLNYEEQLQDGECGYDGKRFSMETEAEQCRSLDEALRLWKTLLSSSPLPAVRSPKQTSSSIQIMAALYRLLGKPLQALDSYLLVSRLSRSLSDPLGSVSALCHLTKLLLEMDCPSLAQPHLEEAEACLKSADPESEGFPLASLTCSVLRSQLCCATSQVEEGVSHLLQVLQDLGVQKQTKSWCFLKANTLQLLGTYLSLPSTLLAPRLRQRLCVHGWRSPDVALVEGRKLLCSIVVTLLGNGVFGTYKLSTDTQFVDQGENLIKKWQVLADVLLCSQRLVSHSSRIGATCEAKAMCLEAMRLSSKLQALGQYAEFLVAKAELELQRGEAELCALDLEHVRMLLELCADHGCESEKKAEVKIKPRKGRAAKKRPAAVPGSPPQKLPGQSQDEDFLHHPLQLRPTVDREQPRSPSPELKPRASKWLSLLTHQPHCPCPGCTDPRLARVCVRWAAARGELEAGCGEGREASRLLAAGLSRCEALGARLGAAAARVLGRKTGRPAGLLDDVAARIHLGLAVSNLEPEKRTWDLLESGLAFLDSRTNPLRELEHVRAGLLTAKAVASICALAAKRDCSVGEIFSQAWAWSPVSSVGKNNKNAKDTTLGKEKQMKARARARKPARIQPPVVKVTSSDEPELPPLGVKLPAPVSSTPAPCTPVQKGGPSAKMGSCSTAKQSLKSKLQFQVFDESSSPLNVRLKQVPAAPRQSRKAKSRFKVMFSDDSDPEEGGGNKEKDEPAPDELSGRKKLGARGSGRVTRQGENQPSEKPSRGGHRRAEKPETLPVPSEGSCPDPALETGRARRGRPPKQAATSQGLGEESVGKAGRRRGRTRAEEPETELMRTIEEEEEGEFEMSVEILRGSESEDEEGVLVTAPRVRAGLGDSPECEVLRRDLGAEGWGLALGEQRKGVSLHPCPSATLSTAMAPLDLDWVRSLLRSAFLSVQPCPPSSLYSHLCRLLALCWGDEDPQTTAFLHGESLAVTARHQMSSSLHSKQRKLKKQCSPDTELSERLQDLKLQDSGPSAASLQCLSALERVFEFPASDPALFPQQDCRQFLEHQKRIPRDVTVCMLSLVAVHPGVPGDTLLLTRLERDSAPVTVRIPTAHRQVSVSTMLGEFDSIQEQQKVISNVTDKVEWWEGRRELDERMKVLLVEMQDQGLGCWQGLLQPGCKDPEVAAQTACLQKQLAECRAQRAGELIKAVLSGSHLLSAEDVHSLSAGLCCSRPDEARVSLQAAVDRLKERTGESQGHVVLILDKDLQKLPWENIPSLRSRSVSRLPSLRFLVGYTAIKEHCPGSVLTQGVNPSRAFYVLNPQANLPGTEERFRDWFSSVPGWEGVSGSAPSQERIQEALSTRDLYIYAGHGAGARFLSPQVLMKMGCHSVSLLFGCSSAALAVRGSLEGSGVVLHYLMAGCPLVLGNLWDVTDRDIDRFTKSLLQDWLDAGPGAPVMEHVIRAREAPRLKHLIGAAPIVYGLPVSLQ
ncbi:separin-like [Acipenser ruthenus]|uniref:separin-like n=1 Tax=Acipenser ruthenus TaxID=7906 RepID=UPI0027410513|nr:separin-like [Acipenser ruthenus]